MALFLGGARGEMWWWWTGARRGDGGTTTGTVWSRGSVASRGMWAGARFDAGLLQLNQEASRAGSQAGPARRRQRLGSERICAMWPAWLIVSRARGGSSTLLRIHSLLASLHILLMAVDNVWHRRLDASGRRRVPRERRDLTMLCWQGSGRQNSEQANRRGSMPSEPSSPRQPQWFPTRGRRQRFCRLKLSGRWINSAEVVRGGGHSVEDSGGLVVAAAAATSTRPHACATMRTGGDGVDGNSQGEIGLRGAGLGGGPPARPQSTSPPSIHRPPAPQPRLWYVLWKRQQTEVDTVSAMPCASLGGQSPTWWIDILFRGSPSSKRCVVAGNDGDGRRAPKTTLAGCRARSGRR